MIHPDEPKTATREEMAAMPREAWRTLGDMLAYCRRMEREHPERADAWRNQAHSFTMNNPTRRAPSGARKRRRAA